jgi:hypothetical protein
VVIVAINTFVYIMCSRYLLFSMLWSFEEMGQVAVKFYTVLICSLNWFA